MNKELLEWTVTYLKQRDITLRKIVFMNIDEEKKIIDVKYKDKQIMYRVIHELSDAALNYKEESQKDTVLICSNIESNFNFLIKNWTKIAKIKNLSIIFVNLKNNDKWLINPYVHNLIADSESLESGLKAIYDTANGDIKEPKQEKKKSKMFDDDVLEEEDSEE